jgi:hypothetical protein
MTTSANKIGAPAALLVGAAAGCFTFGLLYLVGDKSKAINRLLSVYPPSGALSGVLLLGTLVWLLCWVVLSIRWRTQPPSTKFAVNLATILLLAALLLTFPPFVRGI